MLVLADFGYKQSWRVHKHPRLLADVTGDGLPDIVGFGKKGVWIGNNTGDGAFAPPNQVLWDFGYDAGNWRVEKHPRFMADLTGDGRADIVGFGNRGVLTALNGGDGTFGDAKQALDSFGSWDDWQVGRHPRFVADLTGNGCADLVAFGDDGVWTALGKGDGTFRPAALVLDNFGYDAGGWRVESHPRLLADLTGNRCADIVGFGSGGVWVALGNGDGTFQPAELVVEAFGYHKGGWRVDQHPRLLADITGDGRVDIVGFGTAGVRVALSNGDGTFQPPRTAAKGFGTKDGWSVMEHPRVLADVTGHGRADIVAFGATGITVAESNGNGTFGEPRLTIAELGSNAGWRPDQHPRLAVDVTGNGRADIVGFGHHGVHVLRNGDVELDQIEDLVHEHAPIVYFHKHERYFPCPVDDFIEASNEVARTGKYGGLGLELKSRGLVLEGREQPIVEGDLNGDLSVYVNVKLSRFGTDLQYWYFYAFNGPGTANLTRPPNPLEGETRWRSIGDFSLEPCGQHEGDWEHVTVRVDNFTGEPIGVYMAQHGSGSWESRPAATDPESGRLRFYASRNGHAAYPARKRYYTERRDLGIAKFRLLNDTTSPDRHLDARGITQIIGLHFEGEDIADQSPLVRHPQWMKYTGRWGEVLLSRSVAIEVRLPVINLSLGDVMKEVGIYDTCEQEFGPEPPWEKESWRGVE